MSVAGSMITVRMTVLAGLLLLLAGGCVKPAPPPTPPLKKEPERPARTDMTVHVTVRDEQGAPLQDAVVYAAHQERLPPVTDTATIVLANSAFRPSLLIVRQGTTIRFVNNDKVQHHIYSISAAKKIDFLLKKRNAVSAPVTLDRSGIVVLGCAIHDRMVGHVYVHDNPYLVRTGSDGIAELPRLPFRPVDIRVWHPSMKTTPTEMSKHVLPPASGRTAIEFSLPLQSKVDQKKPAPARPRKKGP